MRRFGRRELLGGAALAGAAALGCGQKKDPYRIDKPPVPRVPGWRTGEERWVLSTCALCDADCGIKAQVESTQRSSPARPRPPGTDGLSMR
jgi:anaerobic selenocysteine-containing dehydrogenase